MHTSLHEVRAFAIERHAQNNQQYAGQPYEYHLERVEAKLIQFNYDSFAYRAAAWLHDTVEDTKTSVAEIIHRFGNDVARLVWAVTGVGPNRKARNKSISVKIADYPASAPLKVADRLVNHETSLNDPEVNGPSLKHLRMYLSERTEFENTVKAHISPRMWAALQDQYHAMAKVVEAHA